MGLIPIQVYSDVPWVPYSEVFKDIGFAVNLAGLPALMEVLQNMSYPELARREKRALELRESHFTKKGLMEHIERFMTSGQHDLVCEPLPASVRDDPLSPMW